MRGERRTAVSDEERGKEGEGRVLEGLIERALSMDEFYHYY